MPYVVRLDENGYPITEGIDRIHVVKLSTASVTSHTVPIPDGAFQFSFKRLPVQASMQVNGYPDRIPLDEGEVFGSFEHLRELVVYVEEAKADEEIVLMLFE